MARDLRELERMIMSKLSSYFGLQIRTQTDTDPASYIDADIFFYRDVPVKESRLIAFGLKNGTYGEWFTMIHIYNTADGYTQMYYYTDFGRIVRSSASENALEDLSFDFPVVLWKTKINTVKGAPHFTLTYGQPTPRTAPVTCSDATLVNEFVDAYLILFKEGRVSNGIRNIIKQFKR